MGPATSQAPRYPSGDGATHSSVVTGGAAVAFAPCRTAQEAAAAMSARDGRPRMMPRLAKSLSQRPRLVAEEYLDLVAVDDPRHDSVAKLLVPHELSLLEAPADFVELEVEYAVSEGGLLPPLLLAGGGLRACGGLRGGRGRSHAS